MRPARPSPSASRCSSRAHRALRRGAPAHQTLALSFLVLVGVLLVADGPGQHLDRGYVDFAMAFSLAVELLNLRAASKRAKGRTAT